MEQDWVKNLILYWGHVVSAKLKNGVCIEGPLALEDRDTLRIADLSLLPDQIEDLRLIAQTSKAPGPEGKGKLSDLDFLHGEYLFKIGEPGQDDCEPDFPREKLRCGEFACEVDCHLVMGGDSGDDILARDIRLRRLWHTVNREALEGKIFLYRTKNGGYFPAVLFQGPGDALMLRRLSGEVVPFVPEEIDDITRYPKAGDIRVFVRLLDGSEHRGTVTVNLDEFFMLGLDRNGPRLRYDQIAQLRFYGVLRKVVEGGQSLDAYNKKYYPVSGIQELPREATYVIGVSAARLVAKDVRDSLSPDAQEPAAPPQWRLGLAVASKGIRGFVADEYESGKKPWGNKACFELAKLPEKLNLDRYIYVVRYTLRPSTVVSGDRQPPAEEIELAGEYGPYEQRSYKRIWIDENGELHTEERFPKPDYDPLYGLDNLLGKQVSVTRMGKTWVGYLLRAEENEDHLMLAAKERLTPMELIEKEDGNAWLRIPKSGVTEVRGYGKITAFRDNGIGFIDGELYFHVNNMRDKGKQEGLLATGAEISFRLIFSNKGKGKVEADDVLAVERLEELRYAFVEENGDFRLVREKNFFHGAVDEQPLADLVGLDWVPRQRPCVCRLRLSVIRELKATYTQAPVVRWIAGREAPFSLSGAHLAELDKLPKIEGVQYSYGVAVGLKTPSLRIMRAYVDKDWSPSLLEQEKAWERSVFCGPDQVRGLREELLQGQLLLIRYVLGGRMENPIVPKAVSVSTVDMRYPPEVVWRSEASAKAYRFLGIRGERMICSAEDIRPQEQAEAARLQDRIESYEKQTDPAKRLHFLREFKKQGLFQDHPQMREDYLSCGKILLETLKGPDDLTKRMHRQLELADEYFAGREFSEAKKYYEAWLNDHRQLRKTSPKKEANFEATFKRAEERLRQCGAAGDVPSEELIQERPENGVLSEAFVRDRLEKADMALLGPEKAATFQDFLEQFDPVGARGLLEDLSREEGAGDAAGFAWTMAKCYDQLWSMAANPKDREQQDRWLAAALLDAAKEEYTNDAPSIGTYLCRLALKLQPECEEAAALYLAALLLPAEELRKDIIEDSGRLQSVGLTLIAAGKAQEQKPLRDFALNSLLLFSAVPQVKELVVSSLLGVQDTVPELLSEYGALLREYLSGAGPQDLGSQIDLAVERFGSWKAGLFHLETGRPVREYAQSVREELKGLPFQEKAGSPSGLGEQTKGLQALLEKMRGFSDGGAPDWRIAYLEECARLCGECRQALLARSSCLDRDILLPVLNNVFANLQQNYSRLCDNTRPLVVIEEKGLLAGRDEDQLRLRVQVRVEGNRQTAWRPVLELKESADFTLVGKTKLCSEEDREQLSAGETARPVGFEFWIIPAEETCEIVSLEARIRYDYKSGRFDGPDCGDGFALAQVPGDGEYQKIEIPVDAKERNKIDRERIERLTNNGITLGQDPEWDDSLRRILRNREKDVDEIIKMLRAKDTPDGMVLSPGPQWIILQGQWRVGKTTVLRIIGDKIDASKTCVVFFTLTGIRGNYESRFAKQVLNEVIKSVEKAAEREDGALWRRGKALLGELTEGRDIAALYDLTQLLNRFVAELQRIDRQAGVLLLIDEFTRVYGSLKRGKAELDFLSNWATFALETNIATITAGGEFTAEMMERFAPNDYQKAKVKQLQYLDKTAVEAFLRFVIPDEDYFRDSLLPPAIDRLYTLTQGNIFLLKELCGEMIKYINEEPDIRRYVTEDLVMQTVRAIGNSSEYRKVIWFNSLYNPYNEDEEENADESVRLAGDGVRKDNEAILEAIVTMADSTAHICRKSDLACALRGKMAAEKLAKRLNTLETRGIIIRTVQDRTDPEVQIKVDLFYELEAEAHGIRRRT